MELFNIENPYYEKWTVGRPSFKSLEKRALYWKFEIEQNAKQESPKCFNYKTNLKPKKWDQ